LTTYPSSTFTVTVGAGTNTSSTPSVTSISLPAGFTTSATFPLSVPSGGAQISFQSP
jgi:hypothetical protein